MFLVRVDDLQVVIPKKSAEKQLFIQPGISSEWLSA
jgi:hypothetical protein